MRYVTWIDGVEATVEFVSVSEHHVVAHVVETPGEDAAADETSEPVEVVFDRKVMADGSWLLNLSDGRSRSVRVMRDAKGGFEMALPRDVRVAVQAMNERDAWLGGGAGAGHDEGEVTVSMPGRVVKVMAAVGDTVESGQAVLVIEAMKMENEVKAEKAGVVTIVHVAEGDSVEADQVLMEIGDGDDG